MREIWRVATACLCLLLCAVTVLTGCSDQETIRTNWEINFPAGGSVVYEASSGGSFHGDGIRYHVFRYGDGEELDTCLTWREPSAAAAEAANALLDEIKVPEEERIDFSACPLWQGVQEDNSRIYIFLSGQMIYVVENFL